MEFISGEQLRSEQQACFPLVNFSCRKKLRSKTETTFIYTLLFSVSLLTVLLNLLILISISHFRQLHTSTNALIFSLALADLLVGLLIMPLETIRTVESCWYLGRLLCALYPYVIGILTSASLGNLVLISVDRYIAVCDPLQYPSTITMRKTILCTSLNWVFSVIYNALLLLEHMSHPFAFNKCHGECTVHLSSFAVIDLVISFVGPCGVMIGLYINIFVVAISQARSQRTRVFEKTWKSERKATRTLSIIVLTFLICFTPYFCSMFMSSDSTYGSTLQFYLWFFEINSCFNPLIYALLYPWFKRATKHILTLKILQPSSSEFNVL